MKRILIGMSGGVDSSVAAALLKKRGFEVVGGFIKNWSDTKDLWTGECAWRADRRDAIRVAAKLGIDLVTFDFETTYREKVLKRFFDEYEAGETPNPDVLCNEVIKFGLFFDEAMKRGFDGVATGHYARVRRGKDGAAHLLRGVDPKKDQSYFLYRVDHKALRKTLFPLGAYHKSDVRNMARAFGLPTAAREESQGICFIGEVPMSAFLRKKIKSRPGDIVDPDGNVIGRHDGLDLYTIGQRQGVGISTGGHAWYVAGKQMSANTLLVVPSKNHPLLFTTSAIIHDIHWISPASRKLLDVSAGARRRRTQEDRTIRVQVQVRYRQEPVTATIRGVLQNTKSDNHSSRPTLRLDFQHPVRAVAPGQSAVLYRGQECLGGGIIGNER